MSHLGLQRGVVHSKWGYWGLLWGEEDAISAAHLPAAPGEQLPTKPICCPESGAVGATGGNSHLAGFKTKVQSQFLYYHSGNGHNIKLFSFKKQKNYIKITSTLFFPTLSSGGKSDTKGSCALWKTWLVCRCGTKKSREQKNQAPMLMMALKGA